MSERYKVGEDHVPHFVACTVRDWIDVSIAGVIPEYYCRIPHLARIANAREEGGI